MDLSIKEICNFLWHIEHKYKLDEWKIDSIYVWPLIRMKLYYQITEKTEVFASAHPNQNNISKLSKIMEWCKLLLRFIFVMSRSRGEFNDVVFCHPRKVNGVDIYTEGIIEELGEKALVIDSASSTSKKVHSIDFQLKVLKKLSSFRSDKYFLSENDLKDINEIKMEVEDRFEINVKLESLIRKELSKFKQLYKYYKSFLSKLNVKRLHLVVAYFNCHLVAAAKDLGITVIEYQHGTITPYHLGYSYPGGRNIAYTPDLFLTFGDFWQQSVEYSRNIKFMKIGSSNIKKLENLKQIQKNKKLVLFTSQGVIGEKLFNFALESASLLPDYKISFNLHPSESYSLYKSKLNNLGSIPSNFELVDKSVDYFQLLARAEFHVAVFSTTVFEGFMLGARTVLVSMAGIEYMDKVIEKGDCILVENSDDLKNNIHKASVVKNPQVYYSAASKTILKEIKKLC